MRFTTNFPDLRPKPVMIQKKRQPIGGPSGGWGFRTNLLPPVPDAQTYNLWEFVAPTGSSLSGVSVLFDTGVAVTANWGDGSAEAINSNTAYNHTFN